MDRESVRPLKSAAAGWAGRCLLCAAVVTLALSAGPVQAQGVNNLPLLPPQTGPRPVPNPIIDLPPLQITFDQWLHPNAGVPGAPLSPQAQQILQSHNFARQQVQLALNYLLANERNILAGRDELFNTHFGRFYDQNPDTNRFLGQYQQMGAHVLMNPRPLSSTEATGGGQQQQQQPGGPGAGPGQRQLDPPETEIVDPVLVSASFGEFSIEASDIPDSDDIIPGTFLRLLRPGMRVVLVDPLDPTRREIHTVLAVLDEDEFLTVDPIREDWDDVHLHLVVGEEVRPVMDHYLRVVNTFSMIREMLSRPVTYRGDPDDVEFAAFGGFDEELDDFVDGFFATGNATFAGLDLLLGRAADRALRQDGFSTSNSRRNIAVFNQLMDPNNADVMRLLWTEDNDATFGDDDRMWFNNVLTIFGIFGASEMFEDFDPLFGPINQFVGRAFLEELRLFGGDFFGDFDPAVIGLQFDPITGRAIAGTGSPAQQRTQPQWQMILQSFAEFSPDFTRGDVAAVGLHEMQNALFPDGSPQFLEAQAAGAYAAFAAMFQDLANGGMVPSQMFEPPGKRGEVGFFPVVPDFVPVGPVTPVFVDGDDIFFLSTGGGTGVASPGGVFVPGTGFTGGAGGVGVQFGDPFAMPIIIEE